MSRLKNMSNFENEWSNAMGNASVRPPARVWDRVEVALDNPGSSGSKKGFLLIPLLAAASISLALAATAVWTSGYWDSADEQYISQQNVETQLESELDGKSGDNSLIADSDDEQNAGDDENSSASQNGLATTTQEISNGQDVAETDDLIVDPDNKVPVDLSSNPGNNLAQTNVSKTNSDGGPVLPIGEFDEEDIQMSDLEPLYSALDVQFGQPEVRPLAMLLGSRRGSLDIWTGMSLAAGSYDPNSGGEPFGGLALAQSDFESNSASVGNTLQSGENIGSSVSIGVGAGFDLSKKWLLQGGISYLRNQNYGFSNAFNPANGQLLRALGADQQFTTLGQTVEYRSEVSFISVPVQMGYYLVNQKFTWILSTGVSSDVFLGDNVAGQGIAYNFNQSPGAESDYNPVNFNLLLGTEFGYTIQERYRLAFSPSLRHGLTPVFRSSTGLENRPIILNLGFRFNYIFR